MYRDESGHTHYYMDENFTDFGKLDWTNLIPVEDRAATLVMLDDHQSCLRRVREALAHGFTHVWFDDNNNFRGADFYTLNQLCAPLPDGVQSVLYKDDAYAVNASSA